MAAPNAIAPGSGPLWPLKATDANTSEIPIVDVGPLVHGTRSDWARVADEVGAAARGFGFFYIANHGVSYDLIDRAYNQANEFFRLPHQDKLQYDIAKSRNHRGYVPVTERGAYIDEQGERHYEAFDSALDLPRRSVSERRHYLMGPNVWPQLRGFREAATQYYSAATLLGRHLCRAFEIHLELPLGYFDPFMTQPTSQLRFLHYLENNAPMAADDMNMGAHTDYECFTILHQTAPGLQVLAADCSHWITAPPIDGTFVINIGDMLEVWTNGGFRSTLHRVVNNGRERFSMPFFMAANYDAVITPVKSMVSADNPQRFAPMVAGHHLMGQLLRDFSYLKARHDADLLDLDFEVSNVNSFEQSKLDFVSQVA